MKDWRGCIEEKGSGRRFYKALARFVMGVLLAGDCPNTDRPTGGKEIADHRKTIKNRLFFTFWGEGDLLSGYRDGGVEIAGFIEILIG